MRFRAFGYEFNMDNTGAMDFLSAKPLNSAEYSKFGQIIQLDDEISKDANQGKLLLIASAPCHLSPNISL